MSKQRFTIIVGTNSTGKTQSALKIVSKYPRHVLAVNPTLEKKFFGFKNSAGSFRGMAAVKPEIHTIKYDGEVFPANVFPEMMNANGKIVKRQTVPKVRFGDSYEKALYPILEATFYSFRNGLLLLDDCSMLLRGSIANSTESIFTARRQNNIDIIAIFHGLGKIPPGLIGYATGMILHKVNEASDTYAYKIPPEILKAKKRVSAKCRRNPFYSEYIHL